MQSQNKISAYWSHHYLHLAKSKYCKIQRSRNYLLFPALFVLSLSSLFLLCLFSLVLPSASSPVLLFPFVLPVFSCNLPLDSCRISYEWTSVISDMVDCNILPETTTMCAVCMVTDYWHTMRLFSILLSSAHIPGRGIPSRRYKCIGVIDQTGKSSFSLFISICLSF